jgi:hypothetical protein
MELFAGNASHGVERIARFANYYYYFYFVIAGLGRERKKLA